MKLNRKVGRIPDPNSFSALLITSGLTDDVTVEGRVVIFNDEGGVNYKKALMWREGNVYYIGLTEKNLDGILNGGYHSIRFHINVKCNVRPKSDPLHLYFRLFKDGAVVENDFENVWGPCLAKPEGLDKEEGLNGPKWILRRGCSLHNLSGWSYINGPYTGFKRVLRWLFG